MGTVLRLVVCACVLLVAVASASAPKRHSFDNAMQVEGDFERTWSAVIEVFAANNWLIQNMAKDSGLIATDWMSLPVPSPFADCGSPGLASVMSRAIRFNAFVREIEQATSVTVNVAIVEMRRNEYHTFRVDCTSTGGVERLIHDEVARALARGPRSREVAAPPPTRAQPESGTAGGPCYGNQTCNAGLACSPQQVCIRVDPPAAPQ